MLTPFAKKVVFSYGSFGFQLHITLFRYLLNSSIFHLFVLLQQAFRKVQSSIAAGASSIVLTFLDVRVAAAAAALTQLELFLEDALCYRFLHFPTMFFFV